MKNKKDKIAIIKNNRFVKSSINLIGRVIGILNTIIILKFLGTGKDVDSFVLTYSFYNYLFNLISPIIEAQTTASLNTNISCTNKIVKSVNIFTIYIIVPISVIFILLLAKFNIFYALICVPVITSNYVAFYFGYAAHKEQWGVIFISNLLRLMVSITIIIITYQNIGIFSAIMGIFMGDVFKYIYLKKRYSQFINENVDTDKDFNKQVAKQIPSHIFNGLTPVINRYIAFHLGIPQIIFIDIAEKIYSGVTLGFAHMFIPPKFNDWSSLFIIDRKSAARKMLKTSLIVGLLFLALSFFFFVLFKELGNLSHITLFGPTMYYFLGLGPYLSTLILVKFIILLKKTHILSFLSVIQILSNIIGSIILTPYWGLSGIALSVSLSSGITTVLLWIYTLKYCR